MSYLRLNTWQSLFSAHWPVVGLCSNHHLLQKEASLMRAKRRTNLWFNEKSLAVGLLLPLVNRINIVGFL